MGRVAVILPVPYRGGTLRAAKDLARMLRGDGEGTGPQVVFARPADDRRDTEQDRVELRGHGIGVRTIEWRTVDREDAERIAAASLVASPEALAHPRYCLPSDGAGDLLDCDFWLFVSDRVVAPLLPIRPYGVFVFDCLQRYVPAVLTEAVWGAQLGSWIPFVRQAEVVLVTTPTTGSDVQTFAGVPAARVRQVPMFFTPPEAPAGPSPWTEPYLVWVTNRSSHKNHARTLEGLRRYYEVHGGRLRTVVLGPGTEGLSNRLHGLVDDSYLRSLRESIDRSPALSENLMVAGEVSDVAYAAAIAGARFLLHSSLYDNGSFAVLDAAYLGVPALSARYPAMEHLDRTFGLHLAWFDPFDAQDLARGLAGMELAGPGPLPSRDQLGEAHWTRCAAEVRRTLAPWLLAIT